MYKILFPDRFADYEFLDSGNGMKLERFGSVVLMRPEPQALWPTQLPLSEWRSLAHAEYVYETSNSGTWKKHAELPNPWQIRYKASNFTMKMELRFTQFKHVGIFPEQCSHWDYIYSRCREFDGQPKVLNLFAYTGGASLAAKAAGADVIHLDSVKPIITWARQNMQRSGLNDIRWLAEDALKFVKREQKRGNIYQGIIMDPPAYGLGPKGERWKLEDKLNELVEAVGQILDKDKGFLVFNTYSLNLSAYVLRTMVSSHMSTPKGLELGELAVRSSADHILPLGSYLRFKR